MADKWSEISNSAELKRPWQQTDVSVDVPDSEGGGEATHHELHPSKRTKEEPEVPLPGSRSNGRSSPSFKTLRPATEIDVAEKDGKDPELGTGDGMQNAVASEADRNTAGDRANTNDMYQDILEFFDDGNDVDDDEDEDDNISEISDLSGISSEGWRPVAIGPMLWVQNQMQDGVDPRVILEKILPERAGIPEDVCDLTLWRLIMSILSEPPKRKKLKHINTLDDVIKLLKTSQRIIVLTGAGVSVSCGIPDFRSEDGIYARLSVEYPDLPDPQAMFDIHYFKRNQGPFFKFAKEIYPGQFEPSPSHRFIKLLEDHQKLLHNYTQNIDTLEQVAGIKNVIQCHGSFATATCMVCGYKTDADAVKADIMNQVVPRCPNCPSTEEMAIMKPDIVFFGESLPDKFHRQMEQDKDICDLLIVMGSSLKVRPVALIPDSLPANVPQILINREPLRHLNFDVELLGDCDAIVNELCHRLGNEWTNLCHKPGPLTEITKDQLPTPTHSRNPSPLTQKHNISDDGSRMSFQMASEENSRMSISQEESNTDIEIDTKEFNSEAKKPMKFSVPLAPEVGQSDDLVMMEKRNTSPDSTSDDVLTSSMSSLSSMSAISGSKDAMQTEESEACTEPTVKPSEGSSSSSPSQELSNAQIQHLRSCWQPRTFNLSSRLSDGQFLFLPPNRYVFENAVVYDDGESDDDDEGGGGEMDDDNIVASAHELMNKSAEVLSSASDLLSRSAGEGSAEASSSHDVTLTPDLPPLPSAIEIASQLNSQDYAHELLPATNMQNNPPAIQSEQLLPATVTEQTVHEESTELDSINP